MATDEKATAARKRKGEGHTRREEILAAAKVLFLSEGYERTTVRKIVERVGVTPPALYRHFRDKDEILLEIADEAFSKLIAAFEATCAGAADPLAALRQMMEAYLRFGLRHPDEYRLIFMAKELKVSGYSHRSGPEDPEARGSRGAVAFGLLQRQVGLLIEQGVLRRDDPALLAELIWAAGHGLVSLLITHPHYPWSDREALIRGMVDMPLEGLLLRR